MYIRGGVLRGLSPHPLALTIIIMSSPASSNPFISSPASSGYASAEGSLSPVIVNYGWAEPLYGDEAFPPHLKHDDMAIVNPDYWDEGVDQNAFKGWMCMTEVSVSFLGFLLFLFELIFSPFFSGFEPVVPLPLPFPSG